MTRESHKSSPVVQRVVFQLESKSKKVWATGTYESADTTTKAFKVYRGGRCALHKTPSMPTTYSDLRDKLIETGVLAVRTDHLELCADYIFDAVSAAASVILAGSYSGNRKWKTQDGKTLGEWLKEGPTNIDEEQDSTSDLAVVSSQESPSHSIMPSALGVPGITVSLQRTKKGVVATGTYDPSTKMLIVHRGARCTLHKTPSMASGYSNLRDNLIQDNVLVSRPTHYELSTDHTFNSASEAASVLLASSINGLKEWKLSDGRPLKACHMGDGAKAQLQREPRTDHTSTSAEICDDDRSSSRRLFYLSKRTGAKATGFFCDSEQLTGKFTVQSGAITPVEQKGSMNAGGDRSKIYNELIASGTIRVRDGVPTFQRDHEFSSCSEATDVLSRVSCSAGRDWRDATDTLLGDLRRQQRPHAGANTELHSTNELTPSEDTEPTEESAPGEESEPIEESMPRDLLERSEDQSVPDIAPTTVPVQPLLNYPDAF